MSDRNNTWEKRPTKNRIGLRRFITNYNGDIDCYADTYDRFHYAYRQTRPMFEEMAASMKELAPAAHAFKVALAVTIDIERRAYSQLHDAIFLSDDRSVCSVGISSRYPAPPHRDRTDVAFTWAFVGKCGSRRQRCTTTDEELEQALFGPPQANWSVRGAA